MYSGIDIVRIARIEEMVHHHSASLNKLFTQEELLYCQQGNDWKVASLAGIYAAKEAMFKALGSGFRQGKWTDVEVCHDALGAPFFKFNGDYEAIIHKKSTETPALSISHDGEYAVAQVVW